MTRQNVIDHYESKIDGSTINASKLTSGTLHVRLSYAKLPHACDAEPFYASSGAAAFDLHAAPVKIDGSLREFVTINGGETMVIPTGLVFDIPEGYELQIRPRSGLSVKTDLMIKNSPGTVDSDYTGEVKIIMKNGGELAEVIRRGDRIAQAVLAPVTRVAFNKKTVAEIEAKNTARGNKGFGSTGK